MDKAPPSFKEEIACATFIFNRRSSGTLFNVLRTCFPVVYALLTLSGVVKRANTMLKKHCVHLYAHSHSSHQNANHRMRCLKGGPW